MSKALGCWLTGLKGHCLLALGRVIVYRGELYTQERLEGRKEGSRGRWTGLLEIDQQLTDLRNNHPGVGQINKTTQECK